jgi:hypothetical protein
VKHYYWVLATFPELPSAHAEQRAAATASSWPVAVCRALKVIMQREPLRRKRLSRMQLVVSRVEPGKE